MANINDFWEKSSQVILTNGEMQKLAGYIRLTTAFREKQLEDCRELMRQTEPNGEPSFPEKKIVLEYLTAQNDFIEALLDRIEKSW